MGGPSRSAATLPLLFISTLIQEASPRPDVINIRSFLKSNLSGESVCMIRVLDGVDAFLLREQRLLAVNRFSFAALHKATGECFT